MKNNTVKYIIVTGSPSAFTPKSHSCPLILLHCDSRILMSSFFVALIFPKGCKTEVGWMFKHLDLDADGQLTLQELYDLEHDQNEHCIKPFLDMCDTNRWEFVWV